MKRLLLIGGLMAVFLLIAVLFRIFTEAPESSNLIEVRVGSVIFQAEVADTPAGWYKGLSGRESLTEDRAMLFLFPQPEIKMFWMKDMKFPLDIIWIAGDKIIGIVHGAQPETGEPATIYVSPAAVDKVLEINAGLAAKYGFKEGDAMEL